MPECELQKLDDGRWRCEVCGRETIRSDTRPRRNCRNATTGEPMPEVVRESRTEDQIDALLVICRENTCGNYDAKADACRACGCSSTRSQEQMRRWLSWGRACPRGLFGRG